MTSFIWDEDGYVHHTHVFPCDCGTEGMVIMDLDMQDAEYKQGPTVSIGFWEHHAKYQDTRMSWKDRFRFAWACLKGRPYMDMVMLNRDTALAFAGTIIEVIEMAEDKQSEN